ncbi:MAG: acetate--CoA ligase family protein [Rhizobiales bacterium]|nr:acetate--CoA ligase family protein [Hyphomicrobiales bacterium]
MNKPVTATQTAGTPLRKALFAPDSIALIGASADKSKHASFPQRYLRKHGFTGAIYPVNPGREEVFGERAYESVDKIPHPVDHAFIMLPARLVPDAVEQCAERRVQCVTIFSAGFAEIGEEGRRLQDDILKRARRTGTRILGPNCLGIINSIQHVALSANEALEIPELLPGRVSLLSQSGSLIGSLLSRAQSRGLRFAKMISVGNEADLGIGELGDLLVDDPDTQAILLFIETIRDHERFATMARRAYAVGKPVIAYLLGRSALGNELAASHTGAIAGNSAAVEAFLRDNGVIRVDMFETLIEMASLVIGRRPPGPGKVSVMTTTGGGGALLVDNLGLRGVTVTGPGMATVAELATKGVHISDSPLVDLTMGGTNPKMFGATLDGLLGSSENNAVVTVVGSSSQYRPQGAVVPIIERAQTTTKPIAAFLTPNAEESARMLAEASIAVFRTPEACADAMRAYFEWHPPTDAPKLTQALAADLVRIAQGQGPTSAVDSAHVLTLLGIEQARTVTLGMNAADLSSIPELKQIKFPVAVKIVSPDIAHKTEAGGVILNVADEQALLGALRQMRETVKQRRPGATLEGFAVQEMRQGLAEVLLGYRVDSHVGSTIAVGVGGVLAEVYRDVVLSLAPVSVDTARTMVEKVRGLAPIRGYRNLPPGDIEALARVVAAWSSLATIPGSRITEAELNPLLVGGAGEGVAAVDALIVRQP